MSKDVVNLGSITVPLETHVTDSKDEFWHRHEFIEVFIITSGEIDNEFEGDKRHLRIGDMCIILPGECHCFHRNGPCRHRDFLIRCSDFERVATSINPSFYDAISQKKHEYIKIEPNDILFIEQKSTDFLKTSDVARQKRMEQTIIFYLLSFFYVGQNTEDEDTSSFRAECLSLISINYVFPDACKRIRDKLGYNEKYFCRKFKKSFGVTLVDYVNAKRMGYAHYLLLTTSDSIDSISSQAGILSLSYFHKVYYKFYHKTPAKSRQDKLEVQYNKFSF